MTTPAYQQLGGERQLQALAYTFYETMANHPRYQPLWAMHQRSPAAAGERLAAFLIQLLEGPPRYQQQFGAPALRGQHQHLVIDDDTVTLWLECMSIAAQHHLNHIQQQLLMARVTPVAQYLKNR